MAVLLQLFISFFKIGLFGFGGGYGMLTLIQAEILDHGWMTEGEFIRILGVAEMTPGPIAINAATYVGYKTFGILGSTVATIGVALPSFIILVLVSGFFFKHYKDPLMEKILSYIRPAVAGIILSASFIMAKKIFIINKDLLKFDTSFAKLLSNVKMISLGVFLTIVLMEVFIKKKIHPLIYIFASAIVGMIACI